ncbi:MAG: DUF7670 domain-containing protein [Chloroflexota bacterium]
MNLVRKIIPVLRWAARLIGLLGILLFALLFMGDNYPLFLFFTGDDPAQIFHMWALLAMLVGLALGWKLEGLAALVVLGFFSADILALMVSYTIQSGLTAALELVLAALSFPFGIIPLGGLLYLVCWAWERRSRKPAET